MVKRLKGQTKRFGVVCDVEDRILQGLAQSFKAQHPQALIKVVAAIRSAGRHVLVCSTKGVWKYAQGKLTMRKKQGGHAIERVLSGLQREVREELHLRIESPGVIVRYLGVWERFDDEVPILYICFHVELPAVMISSVILEIEELSGYFWLKPEDIEPYLGHGTDPSSRRRDITLALRDLVENPEATKS